MRPWLLSLVGVVVVAGACSGGGSEPPPPPQDPVRAFVEATYPHGVPYGEARALGPGAEPALLQWLDDPAMAPHRSNIAVTLGILGSAQAGARLVTLIESGSDPLPADDVRLRMDAIMGLGYAAYAGTSPAPLRYLLGGLDTSTWAARVHWQLSDKGDPAARLRMQAALALGLSGSPDALSALQNLQSAGGGGRGGGRGGGGGAALTPSEQAAVAEAIRANQFIAANGMDEYYRTFLIR